MSGILIEGQGKGIRLILFDSLLHLIGFLPQKTGNLQGTGYQRIRINLLVNPLEGQLIPHGQIAVTGLRHMDSHLPLGCFRTSADNFLLYF